MSSLTPEEEKILNTNPRSIIITGLVIILLFFGGLFAWAAFLPFYGAVIAPGTVKVSENKKVVQHLEGGIVDEILVREGDQVAKGQVIIRLKGAQIDASVRMHRGQLLAKLALAARLEAESSMAKTIVWPVELTTAAEQAIAKKVMEKERRVFVSKRRDVLGKISLYRAQIEQLENQIRGARSQLDAEREIIAMLRDEVAAKEDLLTEKYIDKSQVLELRRRLAGSKGRAGSLEHSIAESSQRIEEFRLRIVDLENTYREGAMVESSRVSDEIFQIREKLLPLYDAQSRLDSRAPIAGTVLNLSIHSEDSTVIRPGQALLEIVPEGAELIVEVNVRPNEITKVRTGQPAEVTLSAFDRRSTPRLAGVVDYVSADQVTRETPTGTMSYYVAHVVVDKKELEASGAYLYPGMPAVCYITTEKRTILYYLLEPFMKMADDALRES